MTLQPGKRIGTYGISAHIGAGRMGAVDTDHTRDLPIEIVSQTGLTSFRTIVRVSVLLVVLVCGLPGVVTGQERSGFWIGFDVGGGSVGTSASGTVGSVFSADRSWSGGAAALGLGWAVNPQLLVGIETRGMSWEWWVDDMEGTLDATNVFGILTYYPGVASGFFVKGGLGGSFLTMDVEGFGGAAGNSSHGLGFTTGTGYDFYLGRGFWFTPAVNFLYGQSGDVDFGGDTVIRDWEHNRIDFTVGIKFN